MMMKVPRTIGVLLLFLSLLPLIAGNLYSSEAELKREIDQLKERLAALEEKQAEEEEDIKRGKKAIAELTAKIHRYAQRFDRLYDTLLFETGKKPTFELENFRIGVHATCIAQATNNANAEGPGRKDKAGGGVKATVEMQKIMTGIHGQAYIQLEAGSGTGLDDSLVLYSQVDNDSHEDEHVTFNKFWYEQDCFDKTTTIALGKVDPGDYYDCNRVANSGSRQFLSGVFTSNPVINFPDNSLGFNVAVIPAEWIGLNYMLMNGEGNTMNDLADHLFNIGQIAIKPRFGGKTGIYRFFAYYNKQDHTKWKDPQKTQEGDYGFGISIDQDLGEIISVFGRYAWKNPKVYNPEKTATGERPFSLEQGWSLGLQARGIPWGREKDILGAAVGQVMASDDYKEVMAARGEDEGHLEVYYTISCNEHFSFGPDFQYIWNPFGRDVSDNTSAIILAGLRGHVDF